MWALLEKAVRAEAVTQIEVLPRFALRRGSALHGVAIDKHFHSAHVSREITGVAVCRCQRRRGNARVVLGSFRRTMPQPGLELEQGHWFLGVVELACNRCTRTVAGDPTSRILQRNTCL